MKTNSSLLKIALFLLAVILYGCPEGPYHMYTKVNPDGSCSRELIRTADSSFVLEGDTSNNPFPMKLDSSWKLSFYKRMPGDTSRFAGWPSYKSYETDSAEFSWFAIATKEFRSVKEMAESFRYDNSGIKDIIPDIRLQKKFRWFYTYYEYNETYPVSRHSLVPISKHMSDLEAAALFGEDRELFRGKNGFEILEILQDVNGKAEKWMEHNLYEEIYNIYLDNYKWFEGAPVDTYSFAMEKDTIYKYYIGTDSIEFDDIDDVLNHHFHTTAYTINDTVDDLISNQIDFGMNDIEIDYKLSLPGKIIETNAPFLKNDTLSWKVDNDRFRINDYNLKAISRKPNYWAFVITSLIVAAALLGFLIRRKPA